MKFYTAQLFIKAGSLETNLNAIIRHIQHAKAQHADVIVFPEMCVSGYFLGDVLWESESFLRACEQVHETIRALSKDCAIIFGSIGLDWNKRQHDGLVRKYNALFCALDGSFVTHPVTKYPFWIKMLLPKYRMFNDARYFCNMHTVAEELQIQWQELSAPLKIHIANKKCHLIPLICEDGWDENYAFGPLKALCRDEQHHAILDISASPFALNKQEIRERVFSSHAKTHNIPVIYVNAVGVQNVGKTVYGFDGQSCVYNAVGEVVWRAPLFQEDSILFSLNEKQLSFSKTEPIQLCPLPQTELATLQMALEYCLKHICQQWKISKVVIGLSGGIDSALSAVLLTRILGPQNVYLVNMPSQHNSQLTQTCAKELAHNLGTPWLVIPIQNSVDQCKELLEQAGVCVTNAAMENIQARERGSRVLAALASCLHAPIVCNANKSELTVGYGTLYGDLCGFLCPLADLWKGQVVALARYYNDVIFKKNMIPENIFTVPPSAELSPSQDVTKGLGDPLKYPYHDALFALWVESSPRKNLLDCQMAYQNERLDTWLGKPVGFSRSFFSSDAELLADMKQWWDLYVGLASFKRLQAPPIVAVSNRPFGGDLLESVGVFT